MLQKTCRTCKHSKEWIISEKNPKKYVFYCEKLEYQFEDNKICGFYQKDSRYKE